MKHKMKLSVEVHNGRVETTVSGEPYRQTDGNDARDTVVLVQTPGQALVSGQKMVEVAVDLLAKAAEE